MRAVEVRVKGTARLGPVYIEKRSRKELKRDETKGRKRDREKTEQGEERLARKRENRTSSLAEVVLKCFEAREK